MKKTILIASIMLCGISIASYAQSTKKNKKDLGPEDFPELINANIPGAPKLGKPQLIMGETGPVKSEGMGWAAPAVYDWNGDGKKDLLIGEFASGLENIGGGSVMGSFIRVYPNEGTDESPKFSDTFYYAKGATETVGKMAATGSALSIYTWCCLAFTPRFADLNNDGFEDILAGEYNPGNIIWFRGSEKGFLPGIKLKEVYDPEAVKLPYYSKPSSNPEGMNYWQYSSVAFGDFNDDGTQDMVVGGYAIRLSKNIGTKSNPLFGKRELLLDINGDPLKIRERSEEEIKRINDYYSSILAKDRIMAESGSSLTVPYVVDWDQDGVLDILVTDAFASDSGSAAVTYFRGVRTKEGSRFEVGIPLFTTKTGEKEFPGSWLNIAVTDWNNDGINDLLIGTSVATLDGGKFNHELSWKWENETGITKENHAYTYEYYKEKVDPRKKEYDAKRKKLGLSLKEMEKQHGEFNSGIKGFKYDEPYKTLAHYGYVYVMLGEKK
jgi:hypothetical protein